MSYTSVADPSMHRTDEGDFMLYNFQAAVAALNWVPLQSPRHLTSRSNWHNSWWWYGMMREKALFEGTLNAEWSRSFREPPSGPDDFLGMSNGPLIIDYELLAPSNATIDANGCAATFPNTTDVVRLIYASGVRERNLTDTTGDAPLSPLGAAASQERANSMFTVASSAIGLFGRCVHLPRFL